MLSLLQRLCEAPSVSGNEETVRDIIINEIRPFCDFSIDALGNIIAYKKGKTEASVRLMLDAHMDEVGLIITYISEDGRLKFSPVGIDAKVLLGRRVKIGNIYGVISVKPVHLMDGDERKKMPKADSLCIDIGAESREDAVRYVKIGDAAVFDSGDSGFGDGKVIAKALDNRVGCAILIEMIKQEQPYDLIFTFTVQEEIGLRGAKTAAFFVVPDASIVVETTTAADIAGVSSDKQVCVLGNGPAISFMDNRTVYDKELYEMAFRTAEETGGKCQPKSAVAGGNNAGAIHVSNSGVRTLAVSVPCRYLHTASGVVAVEDIDATLHLLGALSARIAGGGGFMQN